MGLLGGLGATLETYVNFSGQLRVRLDSIGMSAGLCKRRLFV